MRKLILTLLIAASFAGPAFGQAATIGETGVSRPGGAYMSRPAPNASGCAMQCAADGLCMAWDYAEATHVCELKAVTPAPHAAAGYVSGLSARAPAFARAMSMPTTQAPPPPAPIASAPPPPPEQHAQAAPDAGQPSAPGDGLLGGPDPASDGGLRPRSAP